jgi:hypothetical protein
MATHTLPATGVLALGDASPDSVGTWRIHVSGTWTGVIIPKVFSKSGALSASDAVEIGYRTPDSDDIKVTDITANGVYYIRSDTASLILDYTRSSGVVVIDAEPFRG